jgi:tetratricopeptide (TPR) repeat protein
MHDHAKLFAMGAAAVQRRELQAAEQIFRSILQDDPSAHPAWNALAIVALQAGAAATAVEYALRAVELDRRNPLYLANLGIAQSELGELSAAEKALNRALKLKPVYPEALLYLGKVLQKRGVLSEALRAYERSYAMGSRSVDACTTLAKMYIRNGSADRALAVLGQADDPESEHVVPLMSTCLAQLEGPEPAAELLRSAIIRHPGSSSLHLTLSHLLLSLGQWREGWQHFRQRDASSAEPRALRTRVRRLAARLDGKRVLLLGEQGLGDVLFFLRFAREVASRGAVISLVCAPKLATLLAGDPRFAQLVENRADLEGEVDYELLVGDLPVLLEAQTCPAPFALKPDSRRREECLQRLAQLGTPPYLGISWRAGILHQPRSGSEDWRLLSKEVPAKALGDALRGWSGSLVSLQREPDRTELDALGAAARAKVHDLSSFNDNLVDMTALLDVLDEYVAVSNTNIHLLAGLGRRARVLVPYPPEWRWMRAEGQSAWFPGFPVYREAAGRGWAEPLGRLRADLFR